MPKARKKPAAKKQIPYGAVALLWANGRTVSQISDQMGWTKAKSKFPYSYAYGVLKRLRTGISLQGISVLINKKTETHATQPVPKSTPRSPRLECPLCGASPRGLF